MTSQSVAQEGRTTAHGRQQRMWDLWKISRCKSQDTGFNPFLVFSVFSSKISKHVKRDSSTLLRNMAFVTTRVVELVLSRPVLLMRVCC